MVSVADQVNEEANEEAATIELTSSQAEAVRALRSVWPGKPLLLIGATALAQHVCIDRMTDDIDFTVAASIEGFGDELARLPGWTRHRKMEHRFLFTEAADG